MYSKTERILYLTNVYTMTIWGCWLLIISSVWKTKKRNLFCRCMTNYPTSLVSINNNAVDCRLSAYPKFRKSIKSTVFTTEWFRGMSVGWILNEINSVIRITIILFIRNDLSQDEYDSMKEETVEQIKEFTETLDRMSKIDILTNSFSQMRKVWNWNFINLIWKWNWFMIFLDDTTGYRQFIQYNRNDKNVRWTKCKWNGNKTFGFGARLSFEENSNRWIWNQKGKREDVFVADFFWIYEWNFFRVKFWWNWRTKDILCPKKTLVFWRENTIVYIIKWNNYLTILNRM